MGSWLKGHVLSYRSLVRSKLNYESFVYGLACKSYLQMLYPKPNQGIGLSLGVFRTPVESFYLDAHKHSLGVRCTNYLCSKLPRLSPYKNILHIMQCLINIWGCLMQAKSSLYFWPLHQAMFNCFQHYLLWHFGNTFIIMLPLWCIKQGKIMLDLAHLKNVSTDTYVYKQLFMEIRDRYRDYIPVYADGSWDGDSVACATVFSSDIVIFMRLPDSACIFIAETRPIIKVLKQRFWYIQIHYFMGSLLCVHARTVFKTGTSLDWDGDTKMFLFFYFANKDIIFGWIPSHTGFRDNDKADSAETSALELPRAKVGVFCYDFKQTKITSIFLSLDKMIGMV